MVLYNGEPISIPIGKPIPTTLNTQVWSIKETGEWFTDHNQYLNRLNFYNKKQFDSELSSNRNLSFFDALNIDNRNFNKIFDSIPIESQLSFAKHIFQLKIYDLNQLIIRFKQFLNKNYQDSLCVNEIVNFVNIDSLKIDLHNNDFIIKQKSTFDQIEDVVSGNIIIPGYSKYLIEPVNNDNESKYIVDGSMIRRKNELSISSDIFKIINDDPLIESFIRLLLCNTTSTLLNTLKTKNLDLYNMILDWNQSKTTILNVSKNISYDHTEPKNLNVPETVDTNLIEEIRVQDDLCIPFVGITEYFDNCFYFNDKLESVPISSKDSTSNKRCLMPNNPLNKLIEVHQFLLTFNQLFYLSPFNFDDLITSIKCTDPFELTGEIVNIKLKGSKQYDPSIQYSKWVRNHNIRDLINSKNSQPGQNYITYEILSNVPASDQRLESIDNNGMRLYISVIISLLCLVIDEDDQWRCQIVDEWFDNNEIDDADLSLDAKLSGILNYNNVNWAERLSKREFHNGYWLIILLGVLQDSMHISKYTKIVIDFTEKILPENLNGNVPKNMFFNFCKKITIAGKVDILWVLMDIVANYSDDIKKWVNGVPRLVNEIYYEKDRILKYKMAESSNLSNLESKLDAIRDNIAIDPNLTKTMMMEIDHIKNNLKKFALEIKYLDYMIHEYEDHNVQLLGVDRFGNRFYWINKKRNWKESDNSLGTDSLFYCGRLWIRGGVPEMVKALLKITTEQYDKWTELAQSKGKAFATKEVFGVYRDPSGSYYSVENEVHVEIVSSKGLLVGDYKLSNIQRKIINEGPENLLLNPNEWYFVQDVSSIRKILYDLNICGLRESKLYSKIFSYLPEILRSFEIKNTVIGDESLDVIEERILKILQKYECNEDELKNLRYLNEGDYNENSKELITIKSREHLEQLAKQINLVHDTKLTKRLIQRLKKLEYRRRLFFEEQGSKTNINSIGISTMNYLEQVDINVIANRKLRKQMDLLTYLLNYRHFKAIENLNRWSNSTEVSKAVFIKTRIESLTVEDLLNQILQKIKANITPSNWVPTKTDVFMQLQETTQGTQPVIVQGQTQQEIQPSNFTNEVTSGEQPTM